MKKLAAFLIAPATGADFLMIAPVNATPTAGKECKVLRTPQSVPAGKIRVAEFFWYGYLRCYDFKSTWTARVARQGKGVVIKHVPMAFNAKLEPRTHIYYMLEVLGKFDTKDTSGKTLHDRVFSQLHRNHRSMSGLDDVAKFMAANDVNGKQFRDAYDPFSMNASIKRAVQLAGQCKIEDTSTVVVQDRYTTSLADAGSDVDAAQALDYLVDRVRSRKM